MERRRIIRIQQLEIGQIYLATDPRTIVVPPCSLHFVLPARSRPPPKMLCLPWPGRVYDRLLDCIGNTSAANHSTDHGARSSNVSNEAVALANLTRYKSPDRPAASSSPAPKSVAMAAKDGPQLARSAIAPPALPIPESGTPPPLSNLSPDSPGRAPPQPIRSDRH